ncbi:rhodanese-like domain-containing protein [Halobacillus shinanisalinarum]|uniref:Rhodanese-like domain-containing protein n=1 Tax=Halobacillus shinanisalinarum TaxID=2932258 RepID=A0ABY4H1W8_9BACI|nr:rhodanese-like domain-containing protein [Halobacillus shinanisalinarum]UOQ94191.1 rhodanese-like domain-containing protein [Halobacillus shinanisalinarum]
MSSIPEINPDELQKCLDENTNLTIIDVREDEEVAQGVIPTAKHIPLGNIPEAVSNLDPDKEYVMVCRSGRRSMNASEYLKGNGFEHVKNLEGGMLSWNGELVF